MKKLVVSVLFLILAIVCISGFIIPLQVNAKLPSIDTATSAMNQAFLSVLAVENAGGNVTELLGKLNSAGTLLAAADNSYNAGDTANADTFANRAFSIANQVSEEAIALSNLSMTQAVNNKLITIFISLGASIVFVVLMLLGWRRFKLVYNKNS